MRTSFFYMLILMISSTKLWATEPVWFGKKDAPRVLFINSAMDLASFEPILTEFVALHPDVRVAYRDVNTLELYYQTIKEQKKPQASLVISSAMDLHLKLVNDGYAQTYQSSFTDLVWLSILNGETSFLLFHWSPLSCW